MDARDAGEPAEALKFKTDLFRDLLWVIKGFERLCTRRTYAGLSGVPLPIPFVEIEAYLNVMGIRDLDRREQFVDLIEVLDADWLEKRTPEGEITNGDPVPQH